jgi:hypothetical protein
MADEFGDFDDDDAFGVEPADPEQVAIKLHQLRREIDVITGRDPGQWEELTDDERELAQAISTVVIQWIASHPNPDAEGLARELHNVRVYLSHGLIEPWDDLDPLQRELAVDLMAIILDWLRRQGAIT